MKMNYLNKTEWSVGEDGIRISNTVTNTAFTDEMHDDMLEIEELSWWYTYRAGVITDLMDRFFDPEMLTLDIGAGNGSSSFSAYKKGYKIGIMEPSLGACKNAKKRGVTEVNCGAVTEDSVLDESIDQMLLCDVLEHIENDEQFLTLLHKKIKRGGKLLITVPAFMCLWSSEDDAIGHFRRYRINSLCDLMESRGFKVRYRSYFMGFLFFPVLFIRVFLEKLGVLKRCEDRTKEEKEKIARSQHISKKGIVRTVLGIMENIERVLMKKQNRVPFGSSIVVVAEKK